MCVCVYFAYLKAPVTASKPFPSLHAYTHTYQYTHTHAYIHTHIPYALRSPNPRASHTSKPPSRHQNCSLPYPYHSPLQYSDSDSDYCHYWTSDSDSDYYHQIGVRTRGGATLYWSNLSLWSIYGLPGHRGGRHAARLGAIWRWLTRLCVCVYVCMYVCVCVCIYIYIYIYMHT